MGSAVSERPEKVAVQPLPPISETTVAAFEALDIKPSTAEKPANVASLVMRFMFSYLLKKPNRTECQTAWFKQLFYSTSASSHPRLETLHTHELP